MPVTHEIDIARRLVRSRGWGVVTAAQVLEGQRELRSSTSFLPTHSQLFDLSRVTSVDASSEESMQILSNSPFSGGSRRAFVITAALLATRDALLPRLIADLQGTHRIFETVAEAEAWLVSGPGRDS